MNTGRKKAPMSWGNRLKRENKRLKEKLAALRIDKQSIEKDLRETRKLVQEIPSLLLLIQDAKIILANRSLQDHLGYTEHEVLGRDLLDFIHPDYLESAKDLTRTLLSNKPVPQHTKNHFISKDGTAFSCEALWKKIRYQGRKTFLLDLKGLNQREMKEMQLRQSYKVEAIERMASNLHRDLEKGLRALMESTNQLHTNENAPDTRTVRLINKLDATMEMGYSICRQLNCLSRSKYKKSEITLFDPKQLVLDAVSITQPKWEKNPENEAKVDIKTYLRASSQVEGNANEIRDAFICIILNAVDALPHGGEIYITTEENSGYVWIYVQDNGIGIPDRIKEKIFDPFFTTKPGQRGGMGLSLVQAITKRNGGEIEVISHEGRGTTFITKLPLAKNSITPKTRPSRNMIKNSQVLIIAEKGILKDLISQCLTAKGGNVTIASTGTEGLKLLKKNKYNMVIADQEEAPKAFIKIIPRIKQIVKNLPVAIIHAGEEEEIPPSLAASGADFILNRPLEMNRILALISEAIARAELS